VSNKGERPDKLLSRINALASIPEKKFITVIVTNILKSNLNLLVKNPATVRWRGRMVRIKLISCDSISLLSKDQEASSVSGRV